MNSSISFDNSKYSVDSTPYLKPTESKEPKPELLYEQGEYGEALELIEAILSKEPNHLEHIELKANCLFKLGEYRQAIEGFERVLQTKGAYLGLPERVFKLIECCIYLSQYEKAFNHLETYHYFNPTSLALKGWIKSHLIPQFSKLINTKKNNTNLIAWRALAYALASMYNECDLDLRSILIKERSHPLAIKIFMKKDVMSSRAFREDFSVAFTLNFKGDYKSTKLSLNYLFNRNVLNNVEEYKLTDLPYYPKLLVILAAADIKAGRILDGIKKIKDSFNYRFDDADIYCQRGILSGLFTYSASKNFSEASFEDFSQTSFEDFSKALNLNPNHILTKKALILYFLMNHQYKDALKCLSDVEEYCLQIEEGASPCISPEEKKFKEENKSQRIEALLSQNGHFEKAIEKYRSVLFHYFVSYPFFMSFREWSNLGLDVLKKELERFLKKEKKTALILDISPPILDLQKKENKESLKEASVKGGYKDSQEVFKLANLYLNLSEYERLFDCLEKYDSFHPLSETLREWITSHLIPTLTRQFKKKFSPQHHSLESFSLCLSR